MYQRTLGNSGLRVAEIGMGCNRLGENYHSMAEWVELVQQAADLGVNLFDTAVIYQDGRSEEVLGQALGNRTDVLIATKIISDRESAQGGFSVARMLREAENSLKRLRRERIDVYQLHSPSRDELEHSDWAEGMRRLREQGKVLLRGVAISTVADGVWLIENGLADVLQITYNIFETGVEEKLLPLAAQRGVGLLGRMPLARGVLTGKFKPGEAVGADHRANLDSDKLSLRIRQAEDLRPLAAGYPGGMARLAHHFSLTPRAISASIPGARTVEQLQENVAASNGQGLPEELRAEIERIRAGWQASGD